MNQSNASYIALGSNLGHPTDNLLAALGRISELAETSLICHSSFYSSAPWGRKDQPCFVNAVAAIDTKLVAGELLRHLQIIETALGRESNVDRWGPRIIDLDILMFGEKTCVSKTLTVPHPLMHQRAFVLKPLLEIAPDCSVPGLGRADECLLQLPQDELDSVIKLDIPKPLPTLALSDS